VIVIEIKNAEAVARQHAGWFKFVVGKKLLRIDLQARVEEEIARRLTEEFAKQGIEAEVRRELPPEGQTGHSRGADG
jgi:hypothetical protein